VCRVFFGANVPPSVHAHADSLLSRCDALLIAGTSLTVWSAYRLVRAALSQAHPGRESVVAVAEQRAKLERAVRETTGGGAGRNAASNGGGGNSISNGSALLAPVTPYSLDLSPSSSSTYSHLRAPAVLPVVILNSGPTRADALVHAAESGVTKIEARTGEALHWLLDVDPQETRRMEEEVRRKYAKKTTIEDPQMLQANMQQHANIE
jgi:hypothetical protein